MNRRDHIAAIRGRFLSTVANLQRTAAGGKLAEGDRDDAGQFLKVLERVLTHRPNIVEQMAEVEWGLSVGLAAE